MNEQPTAKELRDYRMPAVKIGDTVLFYKNAHVNSRAPTMGIVFRNNGQSLDVVEVTGTLLQRFGVKHISDPRLRMNESQREDGAWDYTPAYVELRDRLDTIDMHLHAVDEMFLGTGTNKSDRELLVFHAKRLGMTGYSKRKSDDLRDEIAQRMAGTWVEPEDAAEPEPELVETA